MSWTRSFTYVVFAYAGLAALACLAASQWVARRERQRIADELLHRAEAVAAVLPEGPANAALPGDWNARPVGDPTRITLLDGDGTVLADSHEDVAAMENLAERPELRAARRDGSAVLDRRGTAGDQPARYVAVRIGDAERPRGFVRLAFPADRVERRAADAAAVVWQLWAVTVLLVAALAFLVGRRLAGPLDEVRHAAAAVAAGDEPRSVAERGPHVARRIVAAFNLVTAELGERIRVLRRKRDELEAHSEQLATVLSGMIEGVVAVDEQQRVLFANPAARSMLDFSVTDVVGRPVWEAVRNPTIQETVRHALEGGVRKSVEFQLPLSQTHVAMLASRLPGDPCPGVVLVLHDVTELRRLENLRREFVSNVSHELKTPLTSIQACTETLLDGAVDDPGHNREFLYRIEEQAERLHALVMDVLRLAQIEAGHEVYEMRSIRLDDVVEACVEEHGAVAETSEVTLATEPPAADVFVRADEEGLRTILDNLLDNAINYTPAGGRVLVRWQREDDELALVQVEDTGIGIDDDDRERIFERFYRVDQARSRDEGGTGLGLSIVKHLVGLFGGRVSVDSEIGRGSTFSVRIPLA